jgi:hypothetical protein
MPIMKKKEFGVVPINTQDRMVWQGIRQIDA